MGDDPDIIQKAGLTGYYLFSFWAFVLGSIVAIVAGAAWQFGIPFLASETMRRMAASPPVWEQSASALLLQGFTREVSSSADVEIFVRRPRRRDSQINIDVVLQKQGTTVAYAKVLSAVNNAVWPQLTSDHLLDGTIKIGVGDAVSATPLRAFVESVGQTPVEIIGVGLESSFGGDPNDNKRELSVSRADELMRAAHSALQDCDACLFRLLGLGRALDLSTDGSETERRQRSALIVAIATMQNVPSAISSQDAIITTLMGAPLGEIDLNRYEFSQLAAERLSPPLDLTDPEDGQVWDVPETTAVQAMQRRQTVSATGNSR